MYVLPFSRFPYHLDGQTLTYVPSEKDLGIIVQSKLLWNEHCIMLIKQANQRLGLLRRTLYFTNNVQKRRVFYISLVRSIFEHGSSVWKPCGISLEAKMEKIQKRAVKWILGEQFSHYSQTDYNNKLKQLDLMPLNMEMKFTDLLLQNY